MKLWALSDTHINHPENRAALAELSAHPNDWLILAGDCCDTYQDLDWLLSTLTPKWKRIIWIPGNHELWTHRKDTCQLKGVARYRALVQLCREHKVLTPEDPYVRWPGEEKPLFLVPMFLLYDYTFGPDGLSREQVLAWAAEDGIHCTDERLMDCTPHQGPAPWCKERLAYTRRRLEQLPTNAQTILINHFPLREDLIRLFRIPRFVPWCGTRATATWHTQYRAKVVVSGHLHMRATDWRDDVRFEEVSLGYPRHWSPGSPVESYLREVLPGTAAEQNPTDIPRWAC